MQAYRHSYETDGRKSRLSQEGLLKLMGQVDPIYLERYNHSTVARWESGATRPTKERLEVFGRALSLSVAEVQGMIWLAGLKEDPDGTQSVKAKSTEQEDVSENIVPSDDDPPSPGVQLQTHAGEVASYILVKFALPGSVVAGAGYLLARLGWNAGWIMALYVTLAILLIMALGFLRLRRSNGLREIYFLTVFFLLSGNLLQAPAIRMDPFGFYAIEGFANTPMPYLLSMLVNLILAVIAGLMFDYLWRWQYSSGRGFGFIYLRAAWTTVPPLLFVYVAALFLCCLGMWIFLLLVFSVMGGTFMAILAMKDKETVVNSWERRFLLQAAVGLILILTAIGGASILILYLEPSPLAIPDHTLIRSWEIDFVALGYTADELLERYRIGAVWSSLGTLIYMVAVLGGSLLLSIYRLEGARSSEVVEAESSDTGNAALLQSTAQSDSRLKVLNGAGHWRIFRKARPTVLNSKRLRD